MDNQTRVLTPNLVSFRPQASYPIWVVGHNLGARKPKLRFGSLEGDNSFHHLSSPFCPPSHSKQKCATGQKTAAECGDSSYVPALQLRRQTSGTALPQDAGSPVFPLTGCHH